MRGDQAKIDRGMGAFAEALRPTVRFLLVGELNPYGADPHFALYPEPRGASGDRLCRLVMGLAGGDYMKRFDRVNLCTGKWSKRAAEERFHEIQDSRDGRRSGYVLLGSKVCAAVGVDFAPFTTWAALAGTFVVLPHPSGLSRYWNDAAAYGRARATLQEAGAL